MARKPNYKFDRLERDRKKAAKKAAKRAAKLGDEGDAEQDLEARPEDPRIAGLQWPESTKVDDGESGS